MLGIQGHARIIPDQVAGIRLDQLTVHTTSPISLVWALSLQHHTWLPSVFQDNPGKPRHRCNLSWNTQNIKSPWHFGLLENFGTGLLQRISDIIESISWQVFLHVNNWYLRVIDDRIMTFLEIALSSLPWIFDWWNVYVCSSTKIQGPFKTPAVDLTQLFIEAPLDFRPTKDSQIHWNSSDAVRLDCV